MSMRLSQLLGQLQASGAPLVTEVEISTLTCDSRQVVPGALFFAVRGGTVDGHRFLADAVQRGAAAAVGEEPDPALGIPYVQVPDSRLALADAAAAWHGRPAHRLVMIGVTGTDGKTTTCNLIFRILQAAGLPAGMITTVNAVIGDRVLDTGFHVTTPEAPAIQSYLAEMVKADLRYCVLEATSHGLEQHRVAACEFDLAVVTNITHEHLDYHATFEGYRAAKARLFAGLHLSLPKPGGPSRLAILNRDDPSFDFLSSATRAPSLGYGLSAEADVRAEAVSSGPGGIAFTAVGSAGARTRIHSPLLGAHNVSNCLAAFAVGTEGLHLDPEQVAQGIVSLKGIPGRMERIDLGQPFTAIVDFAHTPNALRRALETARTLTAGKVIVVFGCAGLRDRAKRRRMPEVAIELADLAVFTAEDPRTESLEAILEEMAEGARSSGGVEGRSFWRVLDRAEALRLAVRSARSGDLVIACGKGHEQSMCFGEVEHPWDDRVALRAALSELLAVPGPAMPQLPTGSGRPN